MGAEAETLILCRVAMDSPHESLTMVQHCIREIYHLRPGERHCQDSRYTGSATLLSRALEGGVQKL